jgi:hypothetical protein
MIVLSSQAHVVNQCQSVKKKVLSTNTNVYCSKQCISRDLKPKYVIVKIATTSAAVRFTKAKAQRLNIKDQLKFQHIKKQKLNWKLYQMHLNLIHDWNKSWFLIQQMTDQILDNEMQKKFKIIGRYLSQTETETSKEMDTFYPHVVNASKILFSN